MYIFQFTIQTMANNNIPAILIYGRQIIETYPEIVGARKNFVFDFEITGSENDNHNIREFIVRKLGFTEEEVNNASIIHKNISTDGLKWHIDDCQLIERKKSVGIIYNNEQYVQVSETEHKIKYLYFNTPTKKLPKATFLFYSSTHGIDFDGGILVLADNTRIYPKRNNGFVMDSREAHMVTPVTRGIRNVTVVKIYNR